MTRTGYPRPEQQSRKQTQPQNHCVSGYKCSSAGKDNDSPLSILLAMNQEVMEASPRPSETARQTRGPLRTYPAPWKGQLLLACRKCQKKLRSHERSSAAAKLKKALKSCAKHDEDSIRIRLVEVSCLKLCPKGAVAVCTQAQLGAGACSMIRSQDDVQALYRQCKAEAARADLVTATAAL